EAERAAALTTAYDLIKAHGPSPAFDPRHFAVWHGLFPHGQAAHRRAQSQSVAPQALDLVKRLDEYTFGRGRFEESAVYAKERLDLVEKQNGAESDEFADALIDYGESL